MDQLEISGLSGYVIRTNSTFPELTERVSGHCGYILRRHGGKKGASVAETSAYAVVSGRPHAGPGINMTTAYAVTRQ